MKVDAFITLYNAKMKHAGKPTSELVMKTITDLVKPISYISYDQKILIANQTIKDNLNTEYRTANIYRTFIIYLIKSYTNIDLDEKGFDILMENKMIDLILSTFEHEYKMCSTILQMCLDDMESG